MTSITPLLTRQSSHTKCLRALPHLKQRKHTKTTWLKTANLPVTRRPKRSLLHWSLLSLTARLRRKDSITLIRRRRNMLPSSMQRRLSSRNTGPERTPRKCERKPGAL